MPADVTDNVLEKIVQTKQIAYKLNESVCIANEAELVAFMQVLDRIFFCKSLNRNTTLKSNI
jgi:hypothetical protein